MRRSARVPTLLLTGTVGSGKTAVAVEIGHLLHERGRPTVVVDLDWLGWAHLAPGALSPDSLIVENLAAIWPNFRSAGMECAVLARGLLTRAPLEAVGRAIPEASLTVVRLTASPATIEHRLRRRDTGSELREHLDEAAAMAETMAAAALEDWTVANDGSDVRAAAAEVMRVTGWDV